MRHTARHARLFSYTDFLAWDGRWELIDGEPFSMAPAPTIRHQIILQNLWIVLVQHFRGKPCRPFVAPTDAKLSEQDVVEPDLLVVCEPSKIGEAAILVAPDRARQHGLRLHAFGGAHGREAKCPPRNRLGRVMSRGLCTRIIDRSPHAAYSARTGING